MKSRIMVVAASIVSGWLYAADVPWSMTDTVVSTPGVAIYMPSSQTADLRPIAERLIGDWTRLDRRLLVPSTGRDVLQFTDRNDFATIIDDGGFGHLGMVGLAADPWGPGGPRQAEVRARRVLSRICLTERIPGWRGRLAGLLGDQMPGDPLGMVTMLLVLPAEDSFPPWWTEALLAWCIREDGGPADSAYRTLSHTVLRLEANAMPDPSHWRTDAQSWPYTLRTRVYGQAYGESLADRFPAQFAEMANAHAASVPFWFSDAPTSVVGKNHHALLAEIAADIAAHQRKDVATISGAGLVVAPRLTPVGCELAEIAWEDDQVLVDREVEIYGAGERVIRRGRDGVRMTSWFASAPAGGAKHDLRRGADGNLLGTAAALDIHGRFLAHVRRAGNPDTTSMRLRQPDVTPSGSDLVAIRLTAGGGQQLVRVPAKPGDLNHAESIAVIQDDAVPWSPVVRPDGRVVVWIERTATTSRLVRASLPDFKDRQVLWEVTGTMLEPCFTPDGAAVIVCSDVTGVFNAWRVPLAGNPPEALTNTLGSVIACVTSPDGTTLAVIDFDRNGAYFGLLPAATRAAPPNIRIPLPVPAPHIADPVATPVTVSKGDGVHDVGYLSIVPSTSPSTLGGNQLLGSEFGYGLQAHFGDPARRSHAVLGVGMGDSNQVVGIARYESLHLAPFQLALEAHRHSDIYQDLISTGAGREDYPETVTGGRLELNVLPFVGFAAGIDHYAEVDGSGPNLTNDQSKQVFQGNERYLELQFNLDTRRLYPMSVSPETGIALTVDARKSGFGGQLVRDRVIGQLEGTLSTWPEMGQQLVGRVVDGWSDGHEPLQSDFAVGGKTLNSTTILRGYRHVEDVGDHLGGWSLAYRMPLWRPQFGSTTRPWYFRQFVFEGFFDAAKASTDHAFGNGQWYRSAGGQLTAEFDFWVIRLAPGIRVTRQLDGDRQWQGEFVLGGGSDF